MADIPRFRSYNQTIGDIVGAFTSNYGISNLKIGSSILSALEAAAQSDVRGSQDIFSLLAADALDRAEGLALDRKGADERVPRLKPSPATGLVTVKDTSFAKISSRVFQGTSSPIIGTQSVNIDATEALLFPSSGTVHLGRNTPNYEGPLSYSSKTVNGTYTTINLSSPTTKFHNAGEEVIVGQGGDRNVGVGATMRTPQLSDGSSVEFRTVYNQTILDGETDLGAVLVVCAVAGISGNIPRGGIDQFTSSPFTGATVTNPAPFTNGLPIENDTTYRQRIKDVIASRQKGTDLAVLTSVVNVVSPDEGRRITSASLVSRVDYPSTLYIDDGSGYEEAVQGVGFETLIDVAGGSEQFVQPTNRPIAKAFVQCVNQAPYALQDSAQLAVRVGGILDVHNFDTNDFVSIQNASAYEVVSSINSNNKISFSARTTQGGKYVVLFARQEDNDTLEVTTVDAPAVDSNEKFLFPTNKHYTALLYKNDRLLNKDGSKAVLESLDFDSWLSISGDQTLIVAVDGTPLQSYTFEDQDFIDLETGYGSVGNNSLNAWATVFNARIPGITVTVEDDKLVLTSNRGYSLRAAVVIGSSSTLANSMFSSLSAYGANKDYTLDRSVAQFMLREPLEVANQLTLGTDWTRSFLESVEIASATIASTARMWFAVDANAEVIKIRFGNNYTFTSDQAFPWGHSIKVVPNGTGPTNYFMNAKEGDWMILWDTGFSTRLRKPWRVSDTRPAEAGSVISFDKPASNVAVHDGQYTQLLDFRVAISGGISAPTKNWQDQEGATTATTDIFDQTPGVQTWTEGLKMNVPRHGHAAVTLNNGFLAVFGGQDQVGNYLSSIETYDPVLDTWTLSGLSLATPVKDLSVTKLSTGEILVCGGLSASGAVANCRLFNATVTSITSSPTMVVPRGAHRAILVGTDVFIAGGVTTGDVQTVTTEKYSGGTFSATASMPNARSYFGWAQYDTTRLIAIGGVRGTGLISYGSYSTYSNERYALYNTAGDTWSLENPMFGSTTGPGLEPVAAATATILPNTPGYASGTITATTNGALTVDGYLTSVGDRIAVTLEDTGLGKLANGIYTVTTVGSGGTPYVIARATDLNTGEQINRNPIVFVKAGTTNVSKVVRFSVDNIASFTINVSNVNAAFDTAAQYQLSASYNQPAFLYSATAARRCPVVQVGRGRLSTSNYSTADVFMFERLAGSSSKVEGFTYAGKNPFSAYSNIIGSTAINATATAERQAFFFGGLEMKYGRPIAVARKLAITGDGTSSSPYAFTWTCPDGAEATSVGLAKAGISVVRADKYIDEVSLPANTYTAYTMAQLISSQLRGAFAETYRTNQIRISTASYDDTGDLSLVAQDTVAAPAGFTPAYYQNLTSHLGSASSNTDIGTQSFKPTSVLYATAPTLADFTKSAYLNDTVLGGETIVIRNREYHSAIVENATRRAIGLNSKFDTQLALVETYATNYPRVGLRNDVLHSWAPNEFTTIHSHLAIGPKSDLTVVLDRDADSKRYNIKLYRGLNPSSNTYGATNDFTDADNSNLSLASAFGLNYDFKDFAVYMKARGKSHVGDANRETLWRWFREGVEGEAVNIKYTYADEASQAIKAGVITTDQSVLADNFGLAKVNAYISLSSGTERGNTLFPNTGKIGTAVTENLGLGVTRNYIMIGYSVASASRDGANETTLVLTLPDGGSGTGVADSNLVAGSQLYFKSTNGSWTSGVITVTALGTPTAGTQTITFTNTALGTGAVGSQPTPGTVSLNTEGEALFDVALTNGDYGYSPAVGQAGLPIDRLRTFRVLAHGSQYLQVKVLDRGVGMAGAYTLAVSDRFARYRDAAEKSISIFAAGVDTVASLVTAVNALAANDNSTTPFTGKLVSTGSGSIVLASWDEANSQASGWTLKDGINYIAKVTNTLPLANNAVQYNLKFKRAISSELVSNADWINEKVYLVPVHAQTLAQWLNTFAVTGISNVATIGVSDVGRRLQISTTNAGSDGAVQVQGGLAESVTAVVEGSSSIIEADSSGNDPALYFRSTAVNIARADAAGIAGGEWVDIRNTDNVKKTTIFGTGTEINTITVDGTVSFNSTPVLFTKKSEIAVALVKVEKQGDFVNIEIIHTDLIPEQTLGNTYAPVEGDYIYLDLCATALPDYTVSNMPGGNQGAYRLVRVNSGKNIGIQLGYYRFRDFETAWIENATAVEGTFWCRLVVLDKNSVVPGDSLIIDTDKFGAGNVGSWKVTNVGNKFTDADYTVRLDTNTKSVQPMVISPGPLSAEELQLLSVYEGVAGHYVKKVYSVYPNPEVSSLMTLVLQDVENSDNITEALGSVISVRDKLGFGTAISSGIDAYSYDIGLIGEANKVVYGVAADRDTYPGVAANGSRINISGPVVKRLKLSLSIRTRTGVPRSEVADIVRSAVATVINQSGVGESKSFSDIIAAASEVVGILSVSIVSPTYNSVNDLIKVQPFEKLLILDLENDISITFVGA